MKSLWSSVPNQEKPLPHLTSFCDDSVSIDQIRRAIENSDEQMKPFETPVTWEALQISVD